MTQWHWLIGGMALLILEMLVPGTYFLWLSISAALVGILMILFTVGAEVQWLLFALFSVVSIILWRRYLKYRPIKTDRPTLNRRGEQYIGRTFTLETPIVNRSGKVRVDDSIWKIDGPDLPAGADVQVNGVDGAVLQVNPVGARDAAIVEAGQKPPQL